MLKSAGASRLKMSMHPGGLLLAETAAASEQMLRTWLVNTTQGLRLRVADERLQTLVELPLPEGAVQSVMLRYGRPVTTEVEAEVAGLEPVVDLADGSSLCGFRFRPRYDVIAKDYVVWRVPGQPSRAELATSVAAALEHLARALAARNLRSPWVP